MELELTEPDLPEPELRLELELVKPGLEVSKVGGYYMIFGLFSNK